MKVSNEDLFTIPSESFAIGYSSTGYNLEYSTDGENFTAYDKSVPANEVCIVHGAPKFLTFRLSGNSGDVLIQY